MVIAGHALNRSLKLISITETICEDGTAYEDSIVEDAFDPECNHSVLYRDDIDDVAGYALNVLQRYDLPRPGAPGYFWNGQNGKLAWGSERPESALPTDLGFTGIWDTVLDQFIEERIFTDPLCVEVGYASDFLSAHGEIEWEFELNTSLKAGLGLAQKLTRIQERWLLSIKFASQ